ncbi:MAG: hypothetical protein J7501_04265 [Bdellovibrio sp.]|nr:hypothetical protein [Bdellovibrio sp.]
MRKLVGIFIAVLALSVIFFRNYQKDETPIVSQKTSLVPQKRKVASTQNMTAERASLVDLITAIRQSDSPELRQQLNALPNKNEVLWTYYRDLQVDRADTMERVQVLSLLNGTGGEAELADAALAEALDSESASVIAAFDVFLNNCGTYAQCQQGLLTVIANYPNHSVRAALIAAVNKRFSQQRSEFAADLVRYEINQ